MVTPRRKAALPINVSPPKARRSSIKTDNDETSSTNTENSSSSSKAKRRKIKPMKQLLETMQADYGADPIFQNFNYLSMTAPPSLMPRRKYCDITGLHAPYTDPATGLRYHNADVYNFIKSLSQEEIQAYLRIRNAHITLK